MKPLQLKQHLFLKQCQANSRLYSNLQKSASINNKLIMKILYMIAKSYYKIVISIPANIPADKYPC